MDMEEAESRVNIAKANHERRGRAKLALKQYAEASGDVDADKASTMVDLLADLQHYAEASGLDWTEVTEGASRHYNIERLG